MWMMRFELQTVGSDFASRVKYINSFYRRGTTHPAETKAERAQGRFLEMSEVKVHCITEMTLLTVVEEALRYIT